MIDIKKYLDLCNISIKAPLTGAFLTFKYTNFNLKEVEEAYYHCQVVNDCKESFEEFKVDKLALSVFKDNNFLGFVKLVYNEFLEAWSPSIFLHSSVPFQDIFEILQALIFVGYKATLDYPLNIHKSYDNIGSERILEFIKTLVPSDQTHIITYEKIYDRYTRVYWELDRDNIQYMLKNVEFTKDL